MSRIAFITGSESRFGFGLTGVTHLVAGPGELEEAIDKVISQRDVGLLVIDEHLAREVSDERMREIEHVLHGIVLVLPSPEKGPPEVEDYATRLIRRAIGYHVRLKV